MPCVYCGADDHFAGRTCSDSPTKRHVINDPQKCRFCGADANQVGLNCGDSPTQKHALAY